MCLAVGRCHLYCTVICIGLFINHSGYNAFLPKIKIRSTGSKFVVVCHKNVFVLLWWLCSFSLALIVGFNTWRDHCVLFPLIVWFKVEVIIVYCFHQLYNSILKRSLCVVLIYCMSQSWRYHCVYTCSVEDGIVSI